ncbi:MAG: hypothetical protein RL033_2786 [Pseudomonadota bacterium]|jgi:hypothetical protein
MTPSTGSTERALSTSTEAVLSPRRAGIHLALVLVVVALGGAVLGGAQVAQSAVLGVLLGAANLLAMRRITRGLTDATLSQGGGGAALWALALPFKLVALVGVAFLLVRNGVALAIPLAVGFAVLPLTSVFLPQPSSVRGRA